MFHKYDAKSHVHLLTEQGCMNFALEYFTSPTIFTLQFSMDYHLFLSLQTYLQGI